VRGLWPPRSLDDPSHSRLRRQPTDDAGVRVADSLTEIALITVDEILRYIE
jgi:hypothetical protein